MDDPFPEGMTDWWQKYLEVPTNLASQGPFARYGVFEEGFFPLQRFGELDLMLKIGASIKPRTIMEIGADKGGGLFHWCMLSTVRNVIGCEIRGTPYSALFEKAFPHLNLWWLPESSLRAQGKVYQQLRLWDAKIDVLFIDGDKSYFDVDFYTYRPLMNKNGIVFFHDVTDPVTGAAFHGVVEATKLEWELILDTHDVNRTMADHRRGVPPRSAYEGWLRHWRGRSCGVGVLYLGEKPQ